MNGDLPKRKKLSPYEMLLQTVGAELPGIEYPKHFTKVYDPAITESLEQQKWSEVRDIIGSLGEGLIGIEEGERGKDFYQKAVEDEDGYIRTYNFVKDLKTGVETKLSLVHDVDAIKIEDIQKGIRPDPRKSDEAKRFILGKMFEDTDPISGKFYKGIGVHSYGQALENSIPMALLTLGKRIFTDDKTFNRYPGAEMFVNKLDVGEDGITYDGVKLNLSPEATNSFYEWFGNKISPGKDRGAFEILASSIVGESFNLPFYLLAGGIVGKVATKVAPAFMTSTNLLVKIPRVQAVTFGTLMTANVPRTVVHTMDGGTDALLEDLKHNAEFSLIAGVFHFVGEEVGSGISKLLTPKSQEVNIGISKLFNRAKATDFNTLADVLRKNPQMTTTLVGGFSSAALGYVTGGQDFEERVANALMFASLHFATPSAWKQFAKAKDKNIMVEKDDYDALVMAMRQGKTLQSALQELKVAEPRYYLREGDTLHRIVSDRFVNFGIIEKTGETLDYKSDPTNFQYITQAIPFYRKLYKDALKDYRVKVIADKIEAEGFKNVKNPYKENTEEYYIYEYNKRSTAERLAAIHYSKELYKAIKKNEFPDVPGLNEILKVSAEGLGLPERVYRRMVADIFPEYIKNPEAFIGKLKSEGGSLNFLPKEYRQSFESSLPEIEKQIKRWLNSMMLDKLEFIKQDRTYRSFVKVTDELVKEFEEAQTLADYHRALEKIGYSNQVFEKIQQKIKAKSLSQLELDEFITSHAEELKNARLDYEGGIGILRNNYRHWQVLSSLIDKETIKEIGKTGGIPPELKELLDKYDLEINKDSDFFTETTTASIEKPETAVEASGLTEVKRFPLVEKFQHPLLGIEGVYVEPTPEGVSRARGRAYLTVRNNQIPVTLLDEALNEKGEPLFKVTKTYIVEFPDGKIGLVDSRKLSSIDTAVDYVERIGKMYESIYSGIVETKEVFRASRRYHNAMGERYFTDTLRLSNERFLNFTRKFGSVDKFVQFRIALGETNSRENINKLIKENTYSLQEVLEATVASFRRIIEDSEAPSLYKRFLQQELKMLEPLVNIVSKLDGMRILFVRPNILAEMGLETAAFVPPVRISEAKLKNADAPIILIPNHSEVIPFAHFLRMLIHESVHALTDVVSPVTKFRRISPNSINVQGIGWKSGYYGQTMKQIVEILKNNWAQYERLIPNDETKAWMRALINYTGTDYRAAYTELFTMILADREVAALALQIPYPGVKKGYNLINAAVDLMKAKTLEFYSNFNPEFVDPKAESVHTILDEVASMLDRWLKINGVVDPSTNKFRRGVGYRNLLNHYAEGAARVEGLLDPFEQTLAETEPEYREALQQLGITEEQSMVGVNRLELVRQKLTELAPQTPVEQTQTPVERQTEANPYSITPQITEPANVETFRVGAPKSKSIPIEYKNLVEIKKFAPIESAYRPVEPTQESKPSFEADHKNKNSAEVRPIPKEKKVAELEKVRNERISKEVEYVRTTPFKVGKSEEPILSPGQFIKLAKNGNLLPSPVAKSIKNYFYQTIVPVYRKDFSQRFRDEVYQYGEEMIRYAPYYFNTIVKRIDGWYGGETWRRFAKPDKATGKPTTQEGIGFLQAFKDYEYGRYKNLIERELTWEEFAEWAKFTPSQKKMLSIYKATLDSGIEVMKMMKTRYLTELEPALTKYLSEKKAGELAEKYNVDVKNLDEFLNDNLEIKKEIAKKIIDDNYADWGKTVYYNSVRPVTPDTFILEFSKPTGEVDKNGEPVVERIRTYANQITEAESMVKDMISKGWTKDEMYEVRRIIKYPDQWGKLKAEQLVKLAEEGHIPYNDQVLQALLQIAKKGVDIHSIQKDYIPGMKYTAKEFETQLIDFLREAVYGSYKAYTLTKINENLNRWQGELNDLAKGLSSIKTKGIDNKTLDNLQAEFLYARGYYNQLRASEKSVIDTLRGLTFSYLIGGIKPSFLFMQSVQSLQTGLHLAYKELNNFPQASKFLSEATNEAMNYAFILHAKKKGQKLTGYVYDKEFLDFVDKAEKMNKLKAVGISEMVGIEAEPDYYYSPMSAKIVDGFIRVNNILGAGVEKFTRIQALGLFWKVGKAKGLEGQALEDFVLDNLDKSMTEFGKGGRAPLFESKSAMPNQGTLVNALKKSFLSLKTFSFYNYSLYHSLIKEKAWGALASKALVGLGMHGIKRFPLMAGLFMIAGLFTDDDIDYEATKFADALDTKLPVRLGTFLDKGLASALGTGIDFTNTFAEDSPLLLDMIASTYSPTWEGKLLELTLGAPFGYSRNIVTGVLESPGFLEEYFTDSDMLTEKEIKHRRKIVKKLVPLWYQNIISAMEYEKDGVEVRNRKILAREDLTDWDIFLKALSFPVERINRAYAEAKFGTDAKIRREQQIISTAKQYIKEMRTSKKLPLEAKLKEIKKAEEAMKEAKKNIIKLEQEKRKEQL